MQEQLDRIERKINRLANFLIVAFVLIAVLAVAQTPHLVALLQDNRWTEIGAAALAAVVLLIIRRPFRA